MTILSVLYLHFRNERNWMMNSARVSEKLVGPGLPGLLVATRLEGIIRTLRSRSLFFRRFSIPKFERPSNRSDVARWVQNA